MLKEWDHIWQTVRLALEKQSAEAPDFFVPYWIQAQRLAMPVLLLFTAAASILFAWALLEFAVRRKKQWVLFQRAVVLVACGILCVLVFSPLPVVTQDSYELEVRTRVPGKAEKVMVLTQKQQDAVKELLQDATISRGWETELPYGGYGQTFRIFITTPEGEQCLYLAPEQGCLYSDFDKALIYSVNDYEKLYKAVAQATEGAKQEKTA